MKIAIRADGGSQIGMGHIMRTLVLAKELQKKNNEVFYVCKIDDNSYGIEFSETKKIYISDKYKKGIEKIMEEGFKVNFVHQGRVLADMNSISADILITDSYDVDEEYFHKTKEMFPKTAYIDDMNLYYFNVDFLINPNIDGNDFQYKVNNNTKLMLGCEYILLREEFTNIQPKDINQKVCHIIFTIGGADPQNITEKFLKCIDKLDYNFHVVIGPSFYNAHKLKKFENEKIKLYYNADMGELMKKCDMAISACGSTLYELSACGVPTIGIIVADNQKNVAYKMHKKEIINNIGWYDKLHKDIFVKSIEAVANSYSLRKNMSLKGSQLVDGKGAERISRILLSVK